MTLALPCTAAEFRTRFPMLERTVHLASCSLGARSIELDAALVRMLAEMTAGAAAWEAFEREVDTARERFASLVGASADQIAIVPNASVGAYQVVSGLDLARRRRIVTAADEFPSIPHVWLAQRPRGAEVVFAGPPGAGDTPYDAGHYDALVDDRTALVSVPVVGYGYGTVFPVAEVAELAHAAGARVFVDAYQAAGVLPVDVDELGCDYLVAGTQKYLLGLPGVAFLYVREPLAGDLLPSLTGWFGRVDPFRFDPTELDFAASARRFETGTPSIPSVYAANAGLALVAGLDLHEVRRHVTELIELAGSRLAAQGERLAMVAGPAAHGAHVGLVDDDPGELAARLAERRIAVSPRGSVARLAFHYYNDAGDVDRLCGALAEVRHDRASGALDGAAWR